MSNIINLNTWQPEQLSKRIAIWGENKKFWVKLKDGNLEIIPDSGIPLLIRAPKCDLKNIGMRVAQLLNARFIDVWQNQDGINWQVEIVK